MPLLLGLSLPVIVTTHRLKRGAVHGVHGEEVSFIPLWPQVYVTIFGPKTGVPPLAAARLQRLGPDFSHILARD